VNYGRDYGADVVTDIAAAKEGDACIECGSPLRTSGGSEVGHIFKLGTWYSEAMGCDFLDAEGKSRPVIMGSYGIGVGRLFACIAEEHHDERGLAWPVSVAPYHAHLVALADRTGRMERVATRLYKELQAAGVEVLYDDREESPGVKFMDADLIGLPLRLTVGERSLAKGGVELKRRESKESVVVAVEDVVGRVKSEQHQSC
jgi:prolyl-tRNA synthetase